VFGEHKSIVPGIGETRSIVDGAGEHKSVVSVRKKDKGTGVLGIVPLDIILIGVRGIVPVVFIVGVLGITSLDMMGGTNECVSIVSFSCSVMRSSKP
jgi:hypothetical protein